MVGRFVEAYSINVTAEYVKKQSNSADLDLSTYTVNLENSNFDFSKYSLIRKKYGEH